MRHHHKRPDTERLSITAGDAASAVAEVLGTSVKSAGATVGQQIPEVAGKLASQVQPLADTAQKKASDVVAMARGRSAEFAELVVQAAYEATKSLPKDTRKRVESSLRKTGVEPPRRRRRISRAWLAGGVFAAAGVAFLFSGTVQDRVYDLVDRIRGEDDSDDLFSFPPGEPSGSAPQPTEHTP